MRLSLSEIRKNAIAFAHEWKDASSERAEAQTFWNEFFAVFGIKRHSVASFEEKVRNLKGHYDRIDVFYSGVMIGEHKRRGEDLNSAASQAFEYIQSLTREGRGDEVPQYIVVSDFARIVIYDLEGKNPVDPIANFELAKLHEHLKPLGFLSGYSTKPVDPEDPINIEAVVILGRLHDALEAGGYSGHKLERFLVRILFCLFAEDTGIFDANAFAAMVEQTRTDGSDLGALLARLFDVLNTDTPQRSPALSDELNELRYINGDLFAEDLGFADFNEEMRSALLACCDLHWAKISPAVFGSLFQSIMAGESGARKRRQIGAHYTSERDIMKVIRGLFLDTLKAELAAAGNDKKKLLAFQDELASLRFLDPACGCGNFLVITYRELRLLEIEAVWRLHGAGRFQGVLNVDALFRVNVDQMHGIEIEEWPARIAEVAMWLIDHQMNCLIGEKFGKPLDRLPLKKGAKIVVANALQTDWNSVLPAQRCSFVLGNPPFVGAKYQNEGQRADIDTVANGIKNAGLLDFVCGWYIVASKYIRGTNIRCAFVSTNSITQGEQVGVLWPELFHRGIKIHFGHRTFRWMSEARGKAHVHVVIIGFGAFDRPGKIIYDYSAVDAEPHETAVVNISPYLVPGPDVAITNRSTPICESPEIGIGNKPIDDGNYLFTTEEMRAFVKTEPASKPLFHPWYGSEEFINGGHRWVLWVGEANSDELRAMPTVLRRIENVRQFRLASKSQPTRDMARRPVHFHVEYMPKRRFLVIPKVSSERRDYIPMGFMEPKAFVSDLVFVLPNATLYHFGVLTSEMHMAWVRQVCGRLKSDFRYSSKLVYNNFPWPQEVNEKHMAAVEAAAQAVLDAREQLRGQSLADLYDPLVMPRLLRDAHNRLDRAVDRCYRPTRFDTERQRIEFLFDLYQRLIAPLTTPPKRRTKGN